MPRLDDQQKLDELVGNLTDEQLVELFKRLPFENQDPQAVAARAVIIQELTRRHPPVTQSKGAIWKEKLTGKAKSVFGWIIILLLMLGFTVLPDLFLYQPSGSPYFILASDQFNKLAEPTAESKAAWKMTDYKIFGTPFLLPVNQPSEKKLSETPQTYEITFPYWLSGSRTDRQGANIKGSLIVTVVETQTGWTVQGYVFGPQTPLSFWEQLGAWLLWSALGPFLIFVAYIGLEAINVSKWALIVVGYLIQMVICIYLASVFFGSIWAVILAIILQLFLLFVVVAWYMLDHQ